MAQGSNAYLTSLRGFLGIVGAMTVVDIESQNNGLDVTFDKISYSVKVKKAQVPILHDLSGHFRAGRMTALMGPSGSGKTTLMDILAGRKSGAGKWSGEVLFGGAAASHRTLRRLCGYVEQFDTLVNEFTVHQMLAYTAELKLPRSTSKEKKAECCQNVIETLRLGKCQDTIIGNPLKRGISGGQAKRVNIALALVTRPKVLFLDEPTSGLDSRMANEVCNILKQLTQDGCTVIATIHAPTSFAFSLFDDLFMLQCGGHLIYSGTIQEVRDYFESLSFKFPDDGSSSLSEWLVNVASDAGAGGPRVSVEALADSSTDFAELWKGSERGAECAKTHLEIITRLKESPADVKSIPGSGPGQLHALRTLLSYRMLANYKSGEYLGPRLGDKIFASVLVLTLYWGMGDDTSAQSVQSIASLLYFVAALCGYGAAAYVPSLTLERPLFYRERADGCYMSTTYYLAKFIDEAVLCTITGFLFSLIVFFGLSLQGSFFLFAFAYSLTAMCGITLAYAVASIAPNMEAANALLPTYVTTCMYFGGLFLLFDKIPVGWNWYSYTSFLRYAWGAMMSNQFKGQHTGSLRLFYNEDAGSNVDVLRFYGLDDGFMSSQWGCLGILGGLVLVFACLGALGLTFVSHVKR